MGVGAALSKFFGGGGDAGEQPRDDQGRWTTGGGGGGAKGGRDAREWAKRFAGPLMGKVSETGGFSYKPGAPKSDRTPTDGFMVSRDPNHGEGHVVEIKEMGRKVAEALADADPPPSADHVREAVYRQVQGAVEKWLEKAIPASEKLGKDHYLGGWLQKDDAGHPIALHLDISQHFDARHKDKAVAAGRAQNQMEVWDVKNKQGIHTGGTGRAPS